MIPEASRTTSRPCKSCVGRHRADHRFPRGTNRQCIRQTTIGVRTFIASPHSSAATASLVEERARRRKLAGGLSGTVCRPKRSAAVIQECQPVHDPRRPAANPVAQQKGGTYFASQHNCAIFSGWRDQKHDRFSRSPCTARAADCSYLVLL
jgi:hypothetical protein